MNVNERIKELENELSVLRKSVENTVNTDILEFIQKNCIFSFEYFGESLELMNTDVLTEDVKYKLFFKSESRYMAWKIGKNLTVSIVSGSLRIEYNSLVNKTQDMLLECKANGIRVNFDKATKECLFRIQEANNQFAELQLLESRYKEKL